MRKLEVGRQRQSLADQVLLPFFDIDSRKLDLLSIRDVDHHGVSHDVKSSPQTWERENWKYFSGVVVCVVSEHRVTHDGQHCECT